MQYGGGIKAAEEQPGIPCIEGCQWCCVGGTLGSKIKHLARQLENRPYNGVLGPAVTNSFSLDTIFLGGKDKVAMSDKGELRNRQIKGRDFVVVNMEEDVLKTERGCCNVGP
eukprot:2669310-Ditylum_brightwellii.AAC.1